MSNYIYYFISILILFFSFTANLAASSFNATKLNTDNGLSQNTVRCILEDHNGYLWFGTHDGLNKYDGYGFQIFRNNPGDSLTINNNSITSIYEDAQNTLWIGTISGLNRFNPNNNTFKHYHFWDVGQICPLPAKFYPRIHKKYFLIATGTGLFLFDRNKGRSQKVLISSPKDAMFAKAPIFCFIWQPNSSQPILWLGTQYNGLWRIQLKGLDVVKSSRISLKKFLKSKHAEPEIHDLVFHNDTLWIATAIGLFRLNAKKPAASLQIWQPSPKSNMFKGIDVRSFRIDFKGNYWIGTMRNGLYYYSQTTDKKLKRINDEAIFTIFQDQFHSLWVGTSGSGLYKYNLEDIIFNTYRPFPREKENSHRNHIWAVYQDSSGLVWLGTNHGLQFFYPHKNGYQKSKRINNLVKKLSLLNNFQIKSIISDKRGNIWIGTLEKGLFQYRQSDEKILHYKHILGDSSSLSGNLIYKLFIDNEQNLWVGMNITGLSKAIYRNGRIVAFKNYYNLLRSCKNNRLWILDITQAPNDMSNYLWLASWREGLIRFNKKTDTFKKFSVQNPTIGELNCNYILTLHFSTNSKEQILWIGTYGGGLNKFNLKTRSFTHFTTQQGLANNVIYAILEDKHHNLWLSTNHGLSYFNPHNKHFLNYDEENGLQSAEFNLNAAFKNSSGEFFFGGVNGLNYFTSSNVISLIPPKLNIVKITILGQKGKQTFTAPFNGAIHLNHNQNSLQIEFVGLHSKNPKKHRYAYQLTGWGKEWISVGNQKKVTFINLPAGEYHFTVKACNSDGIWNNKGRTIHIVIRPPFWKTHWALSIYILILLGLFYSFHKIKIKEALKIERIKAEERLQVKKDIEFDFHDELGIRITKIIQFSNLLKISQAKLEAKSKDLVDKIFHHAHELDSELNEFLWEIDLTEATVEDLIVQLKDCSENFFEENFIDFNIQNQIENPAEIKLPYKWRRNILKIFKEGMNNILKHAKHCKNVNLSFELKDSTLQIILTDDGDGFELAEIDPGKGLKSMQKRAETIHAKVGIHSKKGQGTSIRFEGKLS